MQGRKDEKKSPIGFLVIAVIAILSFSDELGGGAVAVLIIVTAFIVALTALTKKGKLQKLSTNNADDESAERAVPVKTPSKVLTEEAIKKEFSHCDDEHYIRLSPEEKRRTELKYFLKNGIIDREEYMLMLRRWNL